MSRTPICLHPGRHFWMSWILLSHSLLHFTASADGVPRVTSDLDCVAILPRRDLEAIAGRGSALAKKH
jgi:hypothetical protein